MTFQDKINSPFLTFEVESVRQSVGEHGAAASSEGVAGHVGWVGCPRLLALAAADADVHANTPATELVGVVAWPREEYS